MIQLWYWCMLQQGLTFQRASNINQTIWSMIASPGWGYRGSGEIHGCLSWLLSVLNCPSSVRWGSNKGELSLIITTYIVLKLIFFLPIFSFEALNNAHNYSKLKTEIVGLTAKQWFQKFYNNFMGKESNTICFYGQFDHAEICLQVFVNSFVYMITAHTKDI